MKKLNKVENDSLEMNQKELKEFLTQKRCGDEIPKNLIRFLFDEIIDKYGGGYDSFIESYNSDDFDEQVDVECIDYLNSRTYYLPGYKLTEYEVERIIGLIDICNNQLGVSVSKQIKNILNK